MTKAMTMLKLSKGSLVASALLFAAVAPAAGSCNLIIDASSDSCETNEDCTNLENTECDTEQGVCVSRDKCQSNAECPADQICRHFSPRTCVSLKYGVLDNPDLGGCQEIYPDDPGVWRDDDTILIGLTAPLTEDLGMGLMPSGTGQSILNAAKLGVYEINQIGGVDLASEKLLALVICDDHGNRDPAEENGRALAAMGIQAMIGPAFSGQTIDTATGTKDEANKDRPGTVDNDMLLISTSATSPDVTGINDTSPGCRKDCGNDMTCSAQCPGLVWRTSPSDTIQGAALNLYFKTDLEAIVRARTMIPDPAIDVTILHKGDSYGLNLANVVTAGLEMNGRKATDLNQTGVFKVRNYGDTSKEGVTPSIDEINGVITDRPDAIFLLGTNEISTIIPLIENGWTGPDETRPYYILADGGLVGEIVDVVVQLDAMRSGTAERFRGSVPGTGPSDGLFTNFASAYNTFAPISDVDGPEVFGAAGAYDAMYLLLYAATAAGDRPLTGQELARNLAKTADPSGNYVQVGFSSVGEASSDLQAGLGIDFGGASGPLDFDLSTGEAPSNIQIWCINPSNPPNNRAPFSGRFYSAATGMMAGTADPGNGSCPF